MFPFSVAEKFIQQNPVAAFVSAVVSLCAAGALALQGVVFFSDTAIGMLLSAVALYVGTFTAFLGLLFNLVTAPLGGIVEPSSYQNRIECIQQTIRCTALSVVFTLLAVPCVIMAQENAVVPLKGVWQDALFLPYNQFVQPWFFSIAVFLLAYAFCLTIVICKQMHSLAMMAVDDKQDEIHKYKSTIMPTGAQSSQSAPPPAATTKTQP